MSITLLACEMSAIVQQFEHSLTLPFFRNDCIQLIANLYGSQAKYIWLSGQWFSVNPCAVFTKGSSQLSLKGWAYGIPE